MMKRWTIVIISALLLVLLLASCKVSDADRAAAGQKGAPTQTGPAWAYTWVTLRCVYDGGTNDMVCLHLDQEDTSLLGSILNSKAAEGWELVDIMPSNSPNGMVQTFIFKKSVE
jgi:hypothetical protein